MKHVAFKSLPIVTPDGTKKVLDYREYILAGIKQPLDGRAVGIEEMHKSVRLLSAMEKADGKGVDLEDADYAHLCEKVKAMRFTWADPAFVQFIEDVSKEQ